MHSGDVHRYCYDWFCARNDRTCDPVVGFSIFYDVLVRFANILHVSPFLQFTSVKVFLSSDLERCHCSSLRMQFLWLEFCFCFLSGAFVFVVGVLFLFLSSAFVLVGALFLFWMGFCGCSFVVGFLFCF